LLSKSKQNPIQPDIREYGRFISYIFIAAFLFFNATIILLTVKMGVDGALMYQYEQYWKNLQQVWNFISLKIIQL
jgi:hypothetical protein